MTEVWPLERLRAELAKPKRNKYGAQRTEVDGIKFDSKREAERYKVLKLARASGLIRDLELQKRYPLEVRGVKICTYVCDFRYIEDGAGLIVEDVKSPATKTRLYKVKRALMKAIYGIEVRET